MRKEPPAPVLEDQPTRRCTVVASLADPGGYPCVHLLGIAVEVDFELLVPEKEYKFVNKHNQLTIIFNNNLS